MNALTKLMRYMRPYRREIIIGIVTVVLPVLMELLIPRLLQLVIDQGIRPHDMDTIVQGSLIMILAAVISAIATIGQGIMRARLSQGIAYDMRNDLFRHIEGLPFSTLDQLRTGGMMTRISSDVDTIRMFSSNGLALLLRALLMIIGSTVLVLLANHELALIMIVCLVIAGIFIWTFMSTSSPLFQVVQRKLAALNTAIQENLAGTALVKAFVRENHEIKRFEQRNSDYMEHNIRVGRILALVMPLLTVTTNLGLVAVIWFGGIDVVNGLFTVGELVAFNNYLMIGMAPVLLLGNMVTMASRAEASAVRVLEVFNTPLQSRGGENAYRPETMRGHVVFDNVTFQYNSGAEDNRDVSDNLNDDSGDQRGNVLENVTFEAQAGQRVALLGVTGSGKTTLVSLITRFYDATAGRILVDNVDVRDWDPEALRAQIGVVTQQPLLFSGTVRENIAYGRPDASLEEVIAAAKAAQAHNFIMSMSEQYDSMIEARGMNLSGGQKQRIAIARALLVAPRILILDDSTSAVDVETEIRIQDALDILMKDATSFIIAQRINSVLNADNILILDNGRIVASGNHSQLLQTSPIYQDIYRSQFGTDHPQLVPDSSQTLEEIEHE
ncbi:MAG: ATP-binding cassette domain-containing protein [Chloroflexi bacterium]|nr:ATP-binding cassette domain-containing protein [Chloroflexota bacterium]